MSSFIVFVIYVSICYALVTIRNDVHAIRQDLKGMLIPGPQGAQGERGKDGKCIRAEQGLPGRDWDVPAGPRGVQGTPGVHGPAGVSADPPRANDNSNKLDKLESQLRDIEHEIFKARLNRI